MVKILSDGATNLYTALAFIILNAAVIALRIISKRKTKNGLRSDDWWLFAAFIFYCVYSGLIIYCEHDMLFHRVYTDRCIRIAVAGVAGSLEEAAWTDPSKSLETIKVL